MNLIDRTHAGLDADQKAVIKARDHDRYIKRSPPMAEIFPDNPWNVLQGALSLTIIAFFLFGAAGFGWHAGTALARVLGL